MARFDVFLVGTSQRLPLEIAAENVQSLAHFLARQRFLVARLSEEAGDMGTRSVMIPISRINFLCEVE
jgi:hypothetical protein